VNAFSTSLAFVKLSNASSTTNGNCGTVPILWPLEVTVSFCPVAAMAEIKANLASFFGMALRILFSTFGGCGCLPLTVLGAKAALPAPLFMRGTLAVALPVPRDSAVVFLPAIGSLPCFCRLLD
jgi:hypothetical protein